MKKLLLATLLMVFLCSPTFLMAKGENEEKTTKDVYAYAYATNFQDSVVYLSALQKIEGAKITHHKRYAFLDGRSAYSEQFKNHVEIVQCVKNVVAAVIFSTKEETVKKKRQKLVKRIKKGGSMFLKEIPEAEFYFLPVEDSDDGLRIID